LIDFFFYTPKNQNTKSVFVIVFATAAALVVMVWSET